MVSIYELKLANEKLEALQFLLGELKELEVVLKSLNLNQLKEVETNVTQSAQSANLIKDEIKRYLSGFETKKQDFDEKYSEISILFEQLKQLKGQIESILQNGLISDNTVSSTTAYSSQKIEQIKSVIESSIQTLTRTQTNLQSQIQSASESINSLNRQVADRYTKSETYSQAEINKKLQSVSTPLATETKAGIVKLKNSINGNAEDMAVTEKAVNDVKNQILGVGQTWKNVKSRRMAGVNYTNSYDRPIVVFIDIWNQSQNRQCSLSVTLNNSITIANISAMASTIASHANVTFIVPPKTIYRVDVLNNPEIYAWTELN